MADYQAALLRHLVQYKDAQLGKLPPGLYRHAGRDIQYDHILPKDHQWLNLLPPIREAVQTYLREREGTDNAVRLHRYFHHLNSSQAFALNLFFPYFEFGESSALISALGLSGEFECWAPEHVADKSEETNVDVMWRVRGGGAVYCEVKLSEREFGTAAKDKAHCDKLLATYKPVLAPHVRAEWLEPGPFFQRYQLFRNVWLAARSLETDVVFLLPRANGKLWEQLQDFLPVLDDRLRSRVHVKAIEDVIDALGQHLPTHPVLSGYTALLKQKYLPSLAGD